MSSEPMLVEDPDAGAFLRRIGALYHAEGANCVLLALLERFAQARGAPEARYLAIDEGGRIRLAAQLRGTAVTLSVGDDDAVDILAGGMPTSVANIAGPRDPAQRLAGILMREALPEQLQILYQIDQPPSERRISGRRRIASLGDVALVQQMLDAFTAEARLPKLRLSARQQIDASRLHVWDDGGVVAMAAVVGGTRNSYRLGTVYTLPDQRGRGYGGALVRDLSRALLSARAFVTLLADDSNEVAHSLYRGMGYRAIERYASLRAIG